MSWIEIDLAGSVYLAANSVCTNTGIPRLVRFFGPQQTALLEKPH